MSKKISRGFLNSIRWWWNTRVIGLFRVRIGSKVKQMSSKGSQVFSFTREANKLASHTENGITVVLTAYKRQNYLPEQIEAIKRQTVKPVEIWVWSNLSDDDLIDVSDLADRVICSNSNFSFWGRFAVAAMARTQFVAFFDDDVLPQPRWFENCLDTIERGQDGILGGSGVILPISGGYSSKLKAGWNGVHSEQTTEVDLVGHAWFMRKDYLKYMWFEEPLNWENGEDIHLSFMALKHGNIKTLVPPHPEHNLDLWSCRPDFGKVVGRTNVATSKMADHKTIRNFLVDKYRANGWNIISRRDN